MGLRLLHLQRQQAVKKHCKQLFSSMLLSVPAMSALFFSLLGTAPELLIAHIKPCA
jgi:hypothetical protein